MNDRTISSIVQSPGGDIWIGTNDGGINILDIVTGRISSLSMVRPGNPDLQSENVKSICFVTPDRALVGLYGGGLALVDRQRGVIRSWNTQNSALQNDYVYAIEPVGDRYWIGTLRGLALFDGERFDGVPGVEIRSEQHNMRISALLCDTRGAVWIGTMNGGLFRYDPSEGGLVSYPYAEADDGLLDEFVNCIVEAHDGTIWVGTNGGLNRLERMPDGMYALSAPVEALRNQVVYGVVEDRTGHLWVSTNRGLACYDPVRGRIRFYSVSDGLQGSQFNQYAFCMAASGEIYFGGIHGITIFDPGRLVTNPFTPTPIIKRLRLFDREVRPGDGHEVLERQISFSDRVVFTARQNVFTLEFVGINYLSCGRNTYAYKLEGFDQEWYHTDRTSVSYSNLSPGRYTFLLRAANNDGVWNDTPRRLEIRVLPVWYRSWWATLIWMTLFGGGCYYLALALRARRRIRQELADSERVARMSEQQLRFFVNVSHELRTPLTMIMLPLTEILDRGISSPWLRQQLDYIGRNARKLMQLVNQFLDYRKAELGVMKLRTCQQEVSETLTEIGLLFDRVAKRRSIEYVLDIRTGSERFIYDPEYLERILSNLLTNAFKYTPEGGRITLSAWGEEGDLVLCVSDTGKGIPTEAQARIFDRFYQQDESIDGAGIGLSFVKKLVELHHGTIRLKSAPGVGSTFTVRLPSSESAYAPDEMAQEGTVSDSALERARRGGGDEVGRLLRRARGLVRIEESVQGKGEVEAFLEEFLAERQRVPEIAVRLALQRVDHVDRLDVGHIVAADRLGGIGQRLRLTLDAHGRYDHGIELVGGLFQPDLQEGLTGIGNLIGIIPHIGNLQHLPPLQAVEVEYAVRVGGRSARRILHNHRSSEQRARSIHDDTFESSFAGLGLRRQNGN